MPDRQHLPLKQQLLLLEADLHELKDRLARAERILESRGYRRCTAAACNCNGYHYCGE